VSNGDILFIAGRRTVVISLTEIDADDMIDEGVIGQSTAMRDVFHQVRMVAPTDSTVLVCGETGTGKELVARAAHRLSARRTHALVKTNCAAIPAALLESELFGHERGAFTGATAQRIGRFELANHGTIFLDEIGEAPLEVQPKLLRVLQEREFERLGSSHTLRTDVRLIAATNANLPQMVAAKRFRADLYYRLNVFPIQLPPLRERRDDIPVLVRHFAREAGLRMNRRALWMSSQTLDALVSYAWPGNIRELQNLIERAVIRSNGDELRVRLEDLDEDAEITGAAAGTLDEAQRVHILATLRKTRWVVSGPRGAAARLGINRSTLEFRMKKLGIMRPPVASEASV
jgi:formate hydrogenlyase transcriptional activator